MLDWIYPSVCELCGNTCEDNLCPDCVASLPRIEGPICLYCGSPRGGTRQAPYYCSECNARPRTFDLARAALARTRATFSLLHRLKYEKANYLASPLASILCEIWDTLPESMCNFSGDFAVVPVPAGRSHTFFRGYNQAEELARAFGRHRDLPVYTPLVRHSIKTGSQTFLSAGERWRNALASYAPQGHWASGRRQLPENIILIDDVYTTGSTIRACARILKTMGASHVFALTLLRATQRFL